MRATSQNPRAAALIGIPVKSMRMIAWGLAAGLAGIAGILLSPKLLMTPDMGNVVMLAFAAAIIGGFSSLVGCVVGGIMLGVRAEFRRHPDLAAGHGGHAVLRDHADPGAASAGPVRRAGVQEGLTMYGELSLRTFAGIVVLLALGVLLPLVLPEYFLYLGNTLMMYAILALGLDLLLGWSGQFAFAHIAFFGIGIYTSALLQMRLGVPFIVGVPIAAILAGLVGLLIAIPATRLRTVYLALATYAFAECAQWVFRTWDSVTKGSDGLRFQPARHLRLRGRHGPARLSGDGHHPGAGAAVVSLPDALQARSRARARSATASTSRRPPAST